MKKVRLTTRITSRETESFNKYLEEIRDIEKFVDDEEFETAKKAQAGDKRAQDELVKKNLRFVVSVAKQYVSEENSLEDLVNEGNYGLIEAAQRFDPDRNLKFITYAVWWIRKDILQYINRNARLIRLPNNKLTLLTKLKKEVNNLEQILERTPSLYEILDYTGNEFDEADIRFFIESERENSYSFDKPVQEEDSQSLMSDLFEDETFGTTDHLLDDNDNKIEINRLLAHLKNDKERKVINMLFGINGYKESNTLEVAVAVNLTRERVRQIKDKCLEYLKKYTI